MGHRERDGARHANLFYDHGGGGGGASAVSDGAHGVGEGGMWKMVSVALRSSHEARIGSFQRST